MNGDSTMALGSLFQCLTSSEEIFPNIQPPLAQIEAIPPFPIGGLVVKAVK